MRRRRYGQAQTWAPGAVVQVGFLKLRAIAQAPPPVIGQPIAWILESLDGSKVYRFTPYIGLESINQSTAPPRAIRGQ